MPDLRIFDEETGEERHLKSTAEAVRFCKLALDAFREQQEAGLAARGRFSARTLLKARCLIAPERYHPSCVLSEPHPDGLFSSAMKPKEGVSGVLSEEDWEVAMLVHFKLHETGKLADRQNLELVRLATVDAPVNDTYGLYPLLLKQIAWEVEQGFQLHPYIKSFLMAHLRQDIKPPRKKRPQEYQRNILLYDLAWKIKRDLGLNFSRNDETETSEPSIQDILAEASGITPKRMKGIVKAKNADYYLEGLPVIGTTLPDFLGEQNK